MTAFVSPSAFFPVRSPDMLQRERERDRKRERERLLKKKKQLRRQRSG
jgi:hypothetical protein